MPVFLLGVPIAAALAWIALKGGRGRSSSAGGGAFGVGSGLAPGQTAELGAGEEPEEEPFKRRELRRRGGGGDDPETYGGEVGGPYGPAAGEGGSEGVYAESPGPTQTYVGGQLRSILGDQSGPAYTYQGDALAGAVRSTPYVSVARDVIGTRPTSPTPAPIPMPAMTPSGPVPTTPTYSGTVKAV